MVPLGKEPSTNASLATAVRLCRVLTWLSTKALLRACHVELGKDSLCRLRLCRAVFAERALGKDFAESLVALCRALGLSAKYQNRVVICVGHCCIRIRPCSVPLISGTVALSFLFDNYCPIMDQLSSKIHLPIYRQTMQLVFIFIYI